MQADAGFLNHMQADAGFLNHVQAGRLLTQAGPLRNTGCCCSVV
jgi:hypothetical protein